MIFITPSTRSEWMMAVHQINTRGLRAVVILVDPQEFGGRPGIENNKAYLEGINIPTYMVKRNEDIALALANHRR